MRLEFEDEELRALAYDLNCVTKRWSPQVTRSYRKRIQQLSSASTEQDIRALKALRLEKLKSNRSGTWSIRIDQKYRLILRFMTVDSQRTAVMIDGLDYH